MIERKVDSMFYPMADGSIEFYPLGVCRRGFVIRSTHEAAAIRARLVRFHRTALPSFLLLCAIPHLVGLLLLGLSQLPTPGTVLVVGGVWCAVISIAAIMIMVAWRRELRKWEGRFERTTGRLTPKVAADRVAVQFSKLQLVAAGAAMALGVVVAGTGLAQALRIESSLRAAMNYIQLWIFLVGLAWVCYVAVRAREQRGNHRTRNSG